MPLSLAVTVTPDRLPAEPTDIAIRLALTNTGSTPLAVAPSVAKLGAIASYAGVGITWNFALGDLRFIELRRWYGPPGNPPGPSVITSHEVTLAPGAEHVTQLAACWIPGGHLEPRHLQASVLDPHGMDELGDLAGSSVLVLGAPWSLVGAGRAADDFLRGNVVAFVRKPGRYELRADFIQDSWMGVGQRHTATAVPVAVEMLPW